MKKLLAIVAFAFAFNTVAFAEEAKPADKTTKKTEKKEEKKTEEKKTETAH